MLASYTLWSVGHLGNRSNRNADWLCTIYTLDAIQLFIAFSRLAADERVVKMRAYGCTLNAKGAAAVVELLKEADAKKYNGL